MTVTSRSLNLRKADSCWGWPYNLFPLQELSVANLHFKHTELVHYLSFCRRHWDFTDLTEFLCLSFRIVKHNYEGKYNRRKTSYLWDSCIFSSLVIQVLGIFFELEPLKFFTTPLFSGPVINNKQYSSLESYFKMKPLKYAVNKF